MLKGSINAISEEDWDDLREAMKNAWHPDLFAAATPMRGIAGYRFDIKEQTGIKHSTEDIRD